ncbi:MAG: hypothetical protein AB1Z98_33195 [Nannocystaceae bacterium]
MGHKATITVLGGLLALGCGGELERDDAGLGDHGSGGGIQLDGSDGSDGSGGGLKLDFGDGDGPSPGAGDCQPGADEDFSYIWVSNSDEGSVSKIDTKTGAELGRYWAGPAEADGDPSRTSVNLEGDVVVSVRDPGGITKIAAQPSGCVDANGNGQIETSTGADDILDWGRDECVLWHTVIPSAKQYNGPRPTAWDARTVVDPDGGCSMGAARVWVGYLHEDGHGVFWRLDGETGEVLDTVDGPQYESRPYGGAVDARGNFWVTGWQHDSALRIDGETLEITDFGNPGVELYGMTLDADGHLWVADRSSTGAVAHLDPEDGSWSVIPEVGGKTRGIQIDRDGQAWLAGNNPCRLVQVDIATETVVDEAIELPGCGDPVGISIDADGFVWVVDRQSDRAYKVDPHSHEVQLTVEGLVGPYTYSDMTGSGLNLVTNPPVG